MNIGQKFTLTRTISDGGFESHVLTGTVTGVNEITWDSRRDNFKAPIRGYKEYDYEGGHIEKHNTNQSFTDRLADGVVTLL